MSNSLQQKIGFQLVYFFLLKWGTAIDTCSSNPHLSTAHTHPFLSSNLLLLLSPTFLVETNKGWAIAD